MSAPIVAVSLAEAIGPLAKAMCESLGVKANVEWFLPSGGMDGWFVASIFDCGRCFSGSGSDGGQALMAANSSRQSWIENQQVAA